MGGLTGTYEHSLDAKGRLFLPAKLQKELGTDFYLAMGMDHCLAIYPEEKWRTFTERFASLPMAQAQMMRPLFASATRCEADKQGRITVPQRLRQYAGLERDVVIIGVHDWAELWDAGRYHKNDEEMTPEKMKALVQQLGI